MLLQKSSKIAFAVALYWTVSISLVFLNKYLLSSPELKLDAPLFVTWFQCIVTLIICLCLSQMSTLFPKKITFPPFRPTFAILRAVFPLSLVFIAMVSFNNLCLKHVGVSFYYIGRSLTTVFNVLLSYVILKETTSLRSIACCAVIVAGFWLGVDQEGEAGNLSWYGVVYGIMASLAVALNAIYTKSVLASLDNCVWQMTMYNNFIACFLFLPIILIFGEISALQQFHYFWSSYWWLTMIMSGFFGFAMGYVTGLQIKLTSPLTHNVSGTAKSCCQTVMAYVYYEETKSFLWWTSNFVVLFASFLYTIVRRSEMFDSRRLKTYLPRNKA